LKLNLSAQAASSGPPRAVLPAEMATKRKLAALAPEDEDPVDPSDELMFLCLGGGNEVGRSCHIIQYKGKTVMVRGRNLAGRRTRTDAV
jgi:hypothetical protein